MVVVCGILIVIT